MTRNLNLVFGKEVYITADIPTPDRGPTTELENRKPQQYFIYILFFLVTSVRKNKKPYLSTSLYFKTIY